MEVSRLRYRPVLKPLKSPENYNIFCAILSTCFRLGVFEI